MLKGKTKQGIPIITGKDEIISPDDLPTKIPHPKIPGQFLILPSRNSMLTQKCKIRFSAFMVEALKILYPGRKFKLNWLNSGMCDHLQAMVEGIAQNSLDKDDPVYIPLDKDLKLPKKAIRNLIENVPPRSLKSTIAAVLFPAWCWIHWPGLRFMFISYSDMISLRDSKFCRMLIESPWYQKRWGESFSLLPGSNTMIRFDNTKGGFRYAVSAQGQIMGMGADVVCCDDLDNTKEIHSKKAREKIHLIWDDVLPTRIDDPKTGCWVILAQRSHQDDISGYVERIDKDNPDVEWVIYRIPAEFESKYRCVTSSGGEIFWQDPRTKEGELINSERFGPEEIRILKRRLRTAFNVAAQLQQRPVPLEGGIFEHDWWQFYRWSALPPIASWSASCISVDMNFGSKSDKASFAVFQAWARIGARYYLLGQARGQWKFTKAKRALIRFVQKYHFIYAIYIENKANGPAIMDELKETYGLSGIIPVDVGKEDGDKEARAEAIAPIIEARNCYVPDSSQNGCSWVDDDFFPEIDVFPMSANNDQVDTLTQAIRKLRGNMAFGIGSDDLEFEDGEDVDTPDLLDLGYGDMGFVGSTSGILGGLSGMLMGAGIGSGMSGGAQVRKTLRKVRIKKGREAEKEEAPIHVPSDDDLEALRALEFAAGPETRIREEVKGLKFQKSDVGGALGTPFSKSEDNQQNGMDTRFEKIKQDLKILAITKSNGSSKVADPFFGY